MSSAQRPGLRNPFSGFVAELRRRRVLPVAGAYIAIAWLVTEIASFLLEQADAPPWGTRLLAIVFIVGFPVAVVLAWTIQVGPDGRRYLDSSAGRGRTVAAAVALGLVAVAGLAWLILPRIEGVAGGPAYRPIPNSVAILPLEAASGTPNERMIAETLFVSLGEGLDQSADLVLMDLRKLHERPRDLAEFGISIKAAALLTGKILQAPGATRIQMDLLDVGQGRLTWSRTFDWDATRIGETGFAIANDVLGAMTLPALSRDAYTGTDNPDAYHAFLMGGQHAASMNIALLATAIEDYQRAIDLDPDYVLAYVALAETINTYRRRKRPEEAGVQALQDRARQALETALELDSESAAAISLLGFLSGDEDLAIQAYERALELDPNHAKSYYRLGWAAQEWDTSGTRTGDLAEAERLFRKALDLDPFNADWHFDLATLMYDLGRDEEAFAEMKRSIELEPLYLDSHIRLGFWEYYDNGRLDAWLKAMIHFREAYALDPEYWDAASWIAQFYAEAGAGEEALAWLDRMLESGPGSTIAQWTGYMVYHQLGYEEEAIQYVVRALELYPTMEFALHAVGTWDIREGRAEQALARWRDAYPLLTTTDRPAIDATGIRALMFYADNLMEAGQTDKAERLLNQCLTALDKWRAETFVRDSVVLDFEQEIYAALELKDETLAAMRTAIVDRENYSGQWMYAFPQFDFLRDEPEFQELLGVLRANLNQQLERIREMERNGELPPAPGVELQDM